VSANRVIHLRRPDAGCLVVSDAFTAFDRVQQIGANVFPVQLRRDHLRRSGTLLEEVVMGGLCPCARRGQCKCHQSDLGFHGGASRFRNWATAAHEGPRDSRCLHGHGRAFRLEHDSPSAFGLVFFFELTCARISSGFRARYPCRHQGPVAGRALERDDHLASRVAAFDVPQCRGRLAQRAGLVDDRLELAGFDEFLQHDEIRVIRLRKIATQLVAHER